jgi:transcriptional regulator with XRE-family HTH domain
MSIVGDRLKYLRTAERLSQGKIAKLAGINQPSVNRYERGLTSPPLDYLMWYADFFDVSMDFIFGRADEPQGRLYNYEPQSFKDKFKDEAQIKQFIEYCFDPDTAANEKLKAVLAEMLKGEK